MKHALAVVMSAAALAPAAAAYGSAARAIVDEYAIATKVVSYIEANVYEVAYEDGQIVTTGCGANAYREAAVVTSRQIIFIDLNEVCTISERRDGPPAE